MFRRWFEGASKGYRRVFEGIGHFWRYQRLADRPRCTPSTQVLGQRAGLAGMQYPQFDRFPWREFIVASRRARLICLDEFGQCCCGDRPAAGPGAVGRPALAGAVEPAPRAGPCRRGAGGVQGGHGRGDLCQVRAATRWRRAGLDQIAGTWSSVVLLAVLFSGLLPWGFQGFTSTAGQFRVGHGGVSPRHRCCAVAAEPAAGLV